MQRTSLCLLFLLLFSAGAIGEKHKDTPDWKVGHVINSNRARDLAMIYHNQNSHTTSQGNLSGTANTTNVGNYSNTTISGNYSGSSTTTSSGTDMPIYRVYEDLIIEADDMVYLTQERIRWRWSKGAQVAVGGEIKYYVEGRKLHILDNEGKEHTVEIVKEIVKSAHPSEINVAAAAPPPANVANDSATSHLTITSEPSGADIEIDGAFVGNTPSTIDEQMGEKEVSMTKKGYVPWKRKVKLTGGDIHVSAELEAVASK